MNTSQQQPGTSGSDSEPSRARRILDPLRSREDWPRFAPKGDKVRRICVLDCETTGLNPAKHQIIELCAAIVLVNESGRVLAVQSVMTGLVDHGHPLSPGIAVLTGLTDADLAGCSILSEELIALLEYCDSVVAFHAQFDRPFVEKLIGGHVPVPWGCAMADVPWRGLGFEPGPQGYALMQCGYFMPNAHRARDDVLALIQLLDHECADGEPIMAKVLAAMDGPAWRFEASTAAFGYKDDLRDKRYRFAPGRTQKLWHSRGQESHGCSRVLAHDR